MVRPSLARERHLDARHVVLMCIGSHLSQSSSRAGVNKWRSVLVKCAGGAGVHLVKWRLARYFVTNIHISSGVDQQQHTLDVPAADRQVEGSKSFLRPSATSQPPE